MKLSKSIIIIIILSVLISSNIYASKISFDGKDSSFSIERLNERERLADLLIEDRYNTKESIKNLSYVNDSLDIENTSEQTEDDTITLYAYPSSYLTNLPYRLYKCIWLKKILDFCDINPKGTFEGELTRYSDDCDFDITTGYEKDSHGYSISEYLISIE